MSLMIGKNSEIGPFRLENRQLKIWGSSLILLFLLFLDIWAACFGLFLAGISILINFDSKDFKKSLVLKAFDSKNLEMGRSVVKIKAKANHAAFYGFALDTLTNINADSKLTLELVKE